MGARVCELPELRGWRIDLRKKEGGERKTCFLFDRETGRERSTSGEEGRKRRREGEGKRKDGKRESE